MADETVQIVIQAVDQISDQLDVITSKLDSFSQQTQSTAQSVGSGINSLISLGNVATSVDHVFIAFENTQLRLENATDRVSNAQDSLARAQEHLLELQDSGTATATQLANAHNEVERATRNVEIAQRNLERANNMVYLSYVNIGVQVLSLLKSIPILISQMAILDTEEIIATGGLALVGAAAAFAAYSYLTMGDSAEKATSETQDLSTSTFQLTDKINTTNLAFSNINQNMSQNTFQLLDNKQAAVQATAATQVLGDKVNWLHSGFDVLQEKMDSADLQMVEYGKVVDQTAESIRKLSNEYDKIFSKLGGLSLSQQKAVAAGQSVVVSDKGGNMGLTSHNDFLMRPGQPAISFSPQDTIIGVKDTSLLSPQRGGGGNVNVYIQSVSGMDPNQLALSLQRQLVTLVRQ